MAKAAPTAGLEKWQLRKLAELGITSWYSKDDAVQKMKEAMKAKAKANEEKQKSGFAAVDAAASSNEQKKSLVKEVAATAEVLPAVQKVDVTAPTINVHVPAPGVTVDGRSFAWYPATLAVFNWLQAAVIGAAVYAALSSRFTDVLAMAVR